MSTDLHIAILAAGQGKRMHSRLPKVLHPVLFRPMIHHVLDLAVSLSPRTLTLIVGHGEEEVKAQTAHYDGIRFARQAEQRGTGHALQQAAPQLEKESGRLLVLSGDVILLTRDTLLPLLATKASAAVLTAVVPNPTGYGRILRGADGRVRAIREEVDCSVEEREVREVNSGVYVFEMASLLPALRGLQNRNQQGEFYLTDVIENLVKEGKAVDAATMGDCREMTGINDRGALAEVEGLLRDRTNSLLMRSGVSLQSPSTTWIDPRCRIAADVRIEGGCAIVGSEIAREVLIESGCRVVASRIGEGTHLKQGSYLESSDVGRGCAIGPYAHLRPGSKLEAEVKIGNFVEVKKSTLGKGAKASHLAYIGDAEIGSEVNLGCGFITCNFDGGAQKHRTIIEDGVFVGSDSQTVAPVRIGRGSYVASGSTVTEDVPADSLVLTRGRQITKPGYAKKYRRKTD